MKTEIKFLVHAQLHTSDYRGDHDTDVVHVIDCPDGTTVKDLAKHLFDHNGKLQKSDYITIRIGEVKP